MPIKKKTANQTWKELKATGQTTLDFKSWLSREKTKGFRNFDGKQDIPVNKQLNDSVQSVIKNMHETGGLKTKAGTEYIFGLKKNIWIGAGIVAVVVVSVIVYKKMQK